MPVWGERFSYGTDGPGALAVKERIRVLVSYLQSLQTGARSTLLK
jgi:hypothetical protein